MDGYENVVLIGAGGAIGPSILSSLLKAGFNITVLTSSTRSQPKLPANVRTVQIDFSDQNSLITALRGQDVVVCTLGAAAILLQQSIIDAAIAVGVKRFIPSEFGSDTCNPKARALPVFGDKIVVQDYLIKKAREGLIEYTLIMSGPFLDWCLKMGLFLDLKGRSVDLYDGGETLFSTTSTQSVGEAVAGVLRHADETKSRAVYVEDILISQNRLVEMAEEIGGRKFEKKVVSTKEVEEGAYAEAKKENPNAWNWINFLKVGIWGEGFGGKFARTDSEMMKVEMTEEGVKEMMAKCMA